MHKYYYSNFGSIYAKSLCVLMTPSFKEEKDQKSKARLNIPITLARAKGNSFIKLTLTIVSQGV